MCGTAGGSNLSSLRSLRSLLCCALRAALSNRPVRVPAPSYSLAVLLMMLAIASSRLTQPAGDHFACVTSVALLLRVLLLLLRHYIAALRFR